MDDQEVLETPEIELDLDTEETSESVDESSTEDIEALKAKAKEADDLKEKNKQLYARLKKQEPKEDKKEFEITVKDGIVLASAGVHPEDIDEIVSHAKFKGISVAEALKTNYIKTYVSEQSEFRKTAATTQTKGGQRGASKSSPDAVIAKAERGEEVDPETLAQARMNLKLGQK